MRSWVCREYATRIRRPPGAAPRAAPAGQLMHRIEQLAAVGPDVLFDRLAVVPGAQRQRRGAVIEPGQESRQAVDFGRREPAPAKQLVEHSFRRQPPHLDEPIHRRPLAPEGQLSARLLRDRHDGQVNSLGHSSVEPYLGLARLASQGRRAVVEEIEADRFFELVDIAAGQEHPRNMRLSALNLRRPLRVGRGALQPCDQFRRGRHVDPLWRPGGLSGGFSFDECARHHAIPL